MIVELTKEEMLTAALTGTRRQIAGMENGWMHTGGSAISETSAFDNHILGCMAELGVAKTFNLFWDDHVGIRNGVDVGGLIEVRARRVTDVHDLPWMALHPKDDKPMPFVLAHVYRPRLRMGKLFAPFELVGWIMGDAGWVQGRLSSREDTRYIMPTIPPLREMDELRTIIDKRAQLFPGDFERAS
jgi:hypothetical protein